MDRQQRQNMEQMVNGDPRPPPSRWQAIRDRLQEIVAPAPMPLEDRPEEQEPQEPRQRRQFGLSREEFRRRQARQAAAAPTPVAQGPAVALQPPVPERRVHGLTRAEFERLTGIERNRLDQRAARERTDGRTGR